MLKQEIASRVKIAEDKKKRETLKHEKENEQSPRRSPRLSGIEHPKPHSEIDQPSHKKKPVMHHERHKPMKPKHEGSM